MRQYGARSTVVAHNIRAVTDYSLTSRAEADLRKAKASDLGFKLYAPAAGPTA